jgi:serine/threonine-protein kinase
MVFGGTVPAPIWAEFMNIVMDGVPVSQFPEDPPNIRDYQVPPQTDVPVVVGLLLEDAETVLRAAFLNHEIIEIPSLDPAGTVVSQSPEPGTTLTQGSFVTIYVSTGETPTGPLPNLVGLTFDEALVVIEEFELATGVLVNLFQQKVVVVDPSRVNRIVSTNPNPGTPITESATVTVFIGQLPGP